MKAKELKKYLDKANKVINKKSSLPIIENLIISGGEMKVTNLGSEYIYKNEIFSGIECLVNFDVFYKMISKLKDIDFILKCDGINLQIDTQKGCFNIGIETDLNDLPIIDLHECTEVAVLNKEHLELINKAVNYAGTDDLRPVMQNILIDKWGFVVASDTNKMCYYKCAPVLADNFMIDKKNASILNFECSVNVYENVIVFDGDNEKIIQTELGGTYPKWRSVIPTETNTKVTINSKMIIETLELASIAGSYTDSIIMEIDENNFRIESKDLDENKSFFRYLAPVNISGDPIKIGFNNKLLSGIAKTENMENITFSFKDNSRGCTINDNVLLMPVMIN